MASSMIVLAVAAAAQTRSTFVDASDRLGGLRTVSVSSDGAGYSGVAMFDYDADGDLDLYVANGPDHPNALLQNDGTGHFTDVAAEVDAQVGTGTSGVLAADLDDDGYPDLVLPGDRSDLVVLRNVDGTRFTNVTAFTGITGAFRNTSAHAADIDNDGLLDVYVAASYVPLQNYMNRLYVNNGDRTFTEIARDAGVARDLGACAATFTHFDESDPYIDLIVANCNDLDIDPTPFEVYRNRGDRTFEDVYEPARIWAIGHFMALAWLDVDDDGRLDFFSTNTGDGRGEPHVLYRNKGDGSWEDVAPQAGVAERAFGWGAIAADLDNDGWEDLYYVGHSHAPDLAYSPGLLFWNERDGTFTEPDIPRDLAGIWNSGLAVGDLDGNGFPDLFIAATDSPEGVPGFPILLMNEGNGNHWLTVRLAGTIDNAAAIGARVRAVAGGRTQLREIHAGDSYMSTNSPWPTFGLGEHTEAELCVRWPNGDTEVFGAFAADQVVDLTQGAGEAGPCAGPEAQRCGCGGPGAPAALPLAAVALLRRRQRRSR